MKTRVRHLMSSEVKTCAPEDTLDTAARLMWDHDLGVLPVVNGARVVGMLTDRDICMAAYTQSRALRDVRVYVAMSRVLYSVMPDTPITDAMQLMRERQVRRLAVVNDDGEVVGALSVSDLAREVMRKRARISRRQVAETLAAICEQRADRARLAA